jgi:hypothetical protein
MQSHERQSRKNRAGGCCADVFVRATGRSFFPAFLFISASMLLQLKKTSAPIAYAILQEGGGVCQGENSEGTK